MSSSKVKVSLGSLLICAFLVACGGSPSERRREWLQFKDQHGREYQTGLEESLRASIFAKNKQFVEQFNREQAAQRGFRLGVNRLADRTSEELGRLSGLRVDPRLLLAGSAPGNNSYNSPEASRFMEQILANESLPVPDQLDWRKFPNRVTEVKDQGSQCGSCWSFASTGVLEGQEAVRAGSWFRQSPELLEPLSEQNLIDCSRENHGCEGGLMASAFEFVKSQGGLQDEKSYPYEGRQNSRCRFQPNKTVMGDSGAALLEGQDEQRLKLLVARYGPVSVGVVDDNADFKFYQSGVYYHENCGTKLGHALLVVGYGTDPEQGDYWLVKNSWGVGWGEAGFARMARNRGNNCGIATMPTIATF